MTGQISYYQVFLIRMLRGQLKASLKVVVSKQEMIMNWARSVVLQIEINEIIWQTSVW